MDERWLPVVGYEESYEVSDRGRIRRIKESSNSHVGRILKPSLERCGYLSIGLRGDGKQKHIKCHRIVAAAFIGARPDGYDAHHIDGCKTNNKVDNIAYVTRSENMRHAIDTGLLVPARGEAHGNSKLTEDNVHEIRNLLGQLSQRAIARMFNVSQPAIGLIATGKNWGWLDV